MNTFESRPLGTVEDFARRINVSLAKAYEVWHLLPAGIGVKIGRRLRVDMQKLEVWLGQGGGSLGQTA